MTLQQGSVALQSQREHSGDQSGGRITCCWPSSLTQVQQEVASPKGGTSADAACCGGGASGVLPAAESISSDSRENALQERDMVRDADLAKSRLHTRSWAAEQPAWRLLTHVSWLQEEA